MALEIPLSEVQAQKLGVTTIPLPSATSGELAGLAAQVVIPGNQLFTISTPLSALVEQSLVGVGDAVKKGQPLATLQSPALAEAQRNFLQAHTQMQLAKENLQRDESLWKDGIISESRLRTSQSQLREANASLSERKQSLKLIGMSDDAIRSLQADGSLSSTLSVTSPIAGVVLEKNVNAGQRLDAATPLFKVARLDPLALEIQVPLAHAQKIKVGDFVILPGLNARGHISAVGRSLSSSNQTILARALITEGASNLRPGQFVEATLITRPEKAKQWLIPNSALVRMGKETVIFVKSTQGFRTQSVTVLNEGTQHSVVSAPLEGNEQIAVQGVSSLKASATNLGGDQ
ncbi:MAG: efflux RND transporter periplasmic adaptor subunit [Sideroxydans sp.]